MAVLYACIDIEASGLGRGCYPIELAIASVDSVIAKAWLIRSPLEWQEQGDWDQSAELLHGIDRPNLMRNGFAPETVVREFMDLAQGYELISDAPRWDFAWLHMLLKVAGTTASTPVLHDLQDVERRITWERRLPHDVSVRKAHHKAANLFPVPHRALPDAQRNAAVLAYLQSLHR